MCGIAGYIGSGRAGEYVLEGLKRLEYRGYDSCGVASVSSKIDVRKDVGMIDEVEDKHRLSEVEGGIAIAHTRWATHGGVTRENAHPHLDCKGEIAVVHNGIISNFAELREELKSRHKFKSDTDTEVIAHLIEEYFTDSLEKAVVNALRRIKGTYALLVVSSREPDKIIACRRESPLLIGLGKDGNFLASDISAFLPFTNRAVALDDEEYAVVTSQDFVVKSLKTLEPVEKQILEIDWSPEQAMKQGYEHFMLKEIHEQPEVVRTALSVYPQEIRKLAERIDRAERVYLTGAGTSLHACMHAEYWFSKLCSKAVIAVDSSELEEKAVLDDKTLVIGVTQSGETYDTLKAMKHAKSMGAEVGAIVNVLGSTATRIADYVVMQSSGIEISVAATKTYTSQLTILLRLAIELARQKGLKTELEDELEKIPELIAQVLEREQEFKEIAESFFTAPNYLYIGRGITLPTALEGALKLKEITYLHAEGIGAGLLKHGTISLIDENMHTVAFLPAQGRNREKMVSNINEVRARGGRILVLALGDFQGAEGVESVSLPEVSEMLSPFVFASAFQLLAYYTAVKLGRNVDKPRALAKSVTVE